MDLSGKTLLVTVGTCSFGSRFVQRVLSEHATFSSRIGGDNPSETGQLFAASLINTDPPRHRQLRSLVTQAFTPRAVQRA